ncbi:hypothetical protein [Salisediminibacterium beveridgei]|uniref:Uncharacterized protein n=1 Tax=Salisediminibacterium beveridgei TaxID=632773 RepID=A0A1D7QRQ0_9BACI|nr:hypothetical protein [Salisediminibacterium beveridgei]AOM81688.1 hypothetical protein BBEV_0294 [Salisediminibacterium beveridgei]
MVELLKNMAYARKYFFLEDQEHPVYHEEDPSDVLSEMPGLRLKFVESIKVDPADNERHLMALNGAVVGWTRFEKSLRAYRKRPEKVIIHEADWSDTSLLFPVKALSLEELTSRELVSMYVAIIQNEIYEAIFSGEQFIAWIQRSSLIRNTQEEKTGLNMDMIAGQDALLAIEEERHRSSQIIVDLTNKVLEQNQALQKLQRINDSLENKYQNLRASKLGKLQIKYWEFKRR